MTDCRFDGRRSLAAFKKGLLNSKNHVTMGLDVVPGAEEQPAVRVLRHWVEAQEFSSGGRSVDQMTELTAHWVLRACCAFLILVAAGIQMSQWRPQAARVARDTIKLCSCLLALSSAVPGLKVTFLAMHACLRRTFWVFCSHGGSLRRGNVACGGGGGMCKGGLRVPGKQVLLCANFGSTRVPECLANQHSTARCCSCLVHCVIEAL